MQTLNVELTLIEEMLGTNPNDEDVYRNFIGSKAPDAQTLDEEVEALGADAVIEKGMTVFLRDPETGLPCIKSYMIKGFFKDACSMLRKATKTKSANLKAFKKEIDGLIFVEPLFIPIVMPDGSDVTLCQRPLRAQTAKGECTALSMSECVPQMSKLAFSISCLADNDVEYVREWLDYGTLRGIGQWRNSGKGRFEWKEISAG